jgi:hypothetical protein
VGSIQTGQQKSILPALRRAVERAVGKIIATCSTASKESAFKAKCEAMANGGSWLSGST